MVLLSNKLDSIFKNSITTPILDTMIEKDSDNPLINDLTKKINTSLLSIKQDITNLELQTEKLSTPSTDEDDAELKESIEDLSKKIDVLEAAITTMDASLSDRIDHLSDRVTVLTEMIYELIRQNSPGDAK